MLRVHRVPGSLMRVLDAFRPCFTAPTFDTFVVLLAGLVARPTQRTVCGMLLGSGMGRWWHHSRAHRFFASARWDLDAVGLVVLRLVVGWLVPVGAPLVVAIDDTMFRRWGRKVHAAHWGYDGSLKIPKGGKKLSRGNCFVVAAVVVELPFADRPVALPVLMRLWRKGGPTKTVLARQLIETIAAARRGRLVHVVADSAYICGQLRELPRGVSLTGTMPRHAGLWQIHPDALKGPPRGRRGRVRQVGDRIGNPIDLIGTVAARRYTVTRYGQRATVSVHEQRCLWTGVFRCRPVRVIVVTEPDQPDIALVTTDPSTPAAGIIERYASRWAIEVAFSEAKNTTGVGEARNRVQKAVERTVPFGLFTQSIVIIWYQQYGHHPSVVRERRTKARWYTTKRVPSYADMIVTLRRVLIAAQYLPGVLDQPTPEEITAVQLAWAHAAA
jgi:hypothetical protein